MTDPVIETEDIPEEQEQFHTYDAGGVYQGIVVATPSQLADLDLTAGKAPAPDMVVLKYQAVAAVKARHAEMLGKLTGGYSSEERDTWSMQLEWARGFLADKNDAHAVLLSGMFPASPTGNMVDDARLMAEKITAKADAYARLTMLAQRLKAQALAAIEAVKTPEQLAITMAALADAETAAIAELAKDTK